MSKCIVYKAQMAYLRMPSVTDVTDVTEIYKLLYKENI